MDLPPAASTLEIRQGMDLISAEQYSAVISLHHASSLIELFRFSTDVRFSSATQRFSRTQQFPMGFRSGDDPGSQEDLHTPSILTRGTILLEHRAMPERK